MRLSIARVSAAGDHTPVIRDDTGFDARGAARRRTAFALAVALILGCIGLLFGSSKPAGADTPIFASGQVFASVGNSAVNVYSQGAGNPQVTRLNDGLEEPYTAGSAFDSSGNFYVADDYSGDVSEYAPDGTLDGVFASGLQNPLSLAFDNQGNLYVGQQTTPYIAEFSKTGQLVANIGPLATEFTGDDWIALGSDECTVYYTTEGTDILRYNMCTNQQEPNLNVQPFASYDPSTGLPVEDFELQVLPDGDVLVADSNADILLDPNGNVLETYTCASLPGCGGSLFAISLDPGGTSFWTGDSASGDIWEVNIASGAVEQQIDTHSGSLYGLSVDDQIEVAAPAPVTTAAPSSLTVAPVTGNFSTPTPVSAVLTNPNTDAPIVNEPVTFTLNGSETCTADTDSTGTATCDITAGEPSSSYTLTASFPGDTTTSTPIGSDSSTTTFTVNPDTSSLTYTGSTSAVNGQPVTLSGTLTTSNPTPGSPLPTKVVTFTIGSGSTAQSCSYTTDVNGNVSCTVATVDQPSGTEPINASFTGDSYDTPATATSSLSVTEPTILTVNPATVTYGGSTTVSGTLTDSNLNQPVTNEPVTFTVNGTETCTGTTDSTGLASCTITPGESTGNYTVSGTFPGDTTQPVPLTTSTSSAAFVVTPAPTTLTYTGANSTTNGQPVVLSGVLTTGSTPLANQPVTLTLGSGTSAQTCAATTTATGAASCTIASTNQPVGPNPVSASYPGTNNYEPASATSTVQVGPTAVSTTLTVTSTTGTYGSPTTVTGTLVNNYTNTPVPGETVILKLNGTQSCTGTTNASGVATCTITPSEPGGSYTLSGSFGGDTTTVPTLLPSTGSGTFVVTKAPTTVTYTGSTSISSGTSPTLSATLTSNGAPVAGQTVTFTVGTGSSAQKCSGTTNSAGTCELRHLHVQPERQPATRHRQLRRQQLLRDIEYVGVGHREHPDVAVGDRRDRDHRSARHRHRHPDQPGDGAGNRWANRDADAQRDTILHGDHGLEREGVVRHHPERGIRHLRADRLVRRQHDVDPVAAQHGSQQLRGHCGADVRDVHRCDDGHQRLVGDPLGHPDEQRHAAGRPERRAEPGHREDGPELHGHHQRGRHRHMQHPVGQPGRRIGLRDRELRRQRVLPVVERIEHRQDRQQRQWRRQRRRERRERRVFRWRRQRAAARGRRQGRQLPRHVITHSG